MSNALPSIGCKGKFPGPKTQQILNTLAKYESRGELYLGNYGVPPVIAEAEGMYMTDVDGNIFLDMTAGFAALNVGHCHSAVVEAVINQLRKVHHTAMLPVEARADVAEKLAKTAPGNLRNNCKIHFDVSGTNAVEITMKLAKAYTKRPNIVSYYGGYHGRSFGTLAVTSDAYLRAPFYPILPGGSQVPFPYCYRCPFGQEPESCHMECVDFIELVFTNRKYGLRDEKSGLNSIAALLLEPAQGASGYIIPPDGYWSKIRKLCDETGILMVDDEIQMGWGRAGKMYCIELWDITPDIIAAGKALTAGVAPMAVAIAGPDIMDAFDINQQSVTFGGSPAACQATLAMLEVLEEESLLEIRGPLIHLNIRTMVPSGRSGLSTL
ncbi:MAG: aminotransferase class III-fold pyridoxal phosphate-dependent enzyme, partial [Bacteroidota bacterium]|nr:aminotransferase class III-fold pyridoxal phosphate-dependent enzyme [Bacteroidota bacterium]